MGADGSDPGSAGGGAPVPTLGQRLTGQARALAARHVPAFPWTGPLAVATRRAATLAATHEGRFARVEVDPQARRPTWPPRPPLPAGPTPLPAGPTPVPGPVPAVPEGAPRMTSAAPATAAVPETPEVPDPPAPRDVAAPRGRAVEPGVRRRLHDAVGPAADLVRVHDDAGADALARGHGADAVTLGADVHFREDRYRPADDRGFGLLVHEAGHVQAGLAPGAAANRSTAAGRAAEERWVTDLERAAVAGRSGGRTAVPETPAPPGAVPAAVDHHAIPLAAPVDRDLEGPPAAEPGAALPAQLAALRRELVADVLGDLRRQLRVEFERGG